MRALWRCPSLWLFSGIVVFIWLESMLALWCGTYGSYLDRHTHAQFWRLFPTLFPSHPCFIGGNHVGNTRVVHLKLGELFCWLEYAGGERAGCRALNPSPTLISIVQDVEKRKAISSHTQREKKKNVWMVPWEQRWRCVSKQIAQEWQSDSVIHSSMGILKISE